MPERFALKVSCALISLWLVVPIFIVVPLAFTEMQSFVFPPSGFSTQWFERFLTDPGWVRDTQNSLIIAFASSILATIIGTCAALGARTMPKQVRAAIGVLLLVPLMIPGVFMAIADYFAFLKLGIVGTYQGFILANVVQCLPLVYIPVTAALGNYDRRLELASSSLGATRLTTLRKVTVPLVLPGIAAGGAFALVWSWDEVLVALFIGSPQVSTLPVRLYRSVAHTTDPTLAAVSALTIGVVTIAVLVALVLRLFKLRSAFHAGSKSSDG